MHMHYKLLGHDGSQAFHHAADHIEAPRHATPHTYRAGPRPPPPQPGLSTTRPAYAFQERARRERRPDSTPTSPMNPELLAECVLPSDSVSLPTDTASSSDSHRSSMTLSVLSMPWGALRLPPLPPAAPAGDFACPASTSAASSDAAYFVAIRLARPIAEIWMDVSSRLERKTRW
eukprot:CAMPEP_0173378036 /NCGR_PEP_ID=MMETSP1356-20130122/1261_1 /TAXON_ID=77927 ORGANISM="Hemiselmis virescens, Strain PCC157" /NCGR_SAMPLE_ID=MMETSP1356 /ASSEMBLY_ACC=CAM_ASM_000847 /LENGTH=174 /DNA_ID=CAMNT_0014330983 /DNA_START=40 /DNA_END=561 /DNA_ORIENTATION=+